VAYLLKTDSIGNLINLVKNIYPNSSFIVYPNPTSDIIQIKNISELNFNHLNYKIFNLFGKEVRFGNLQSITNEIDLTGLIPEIYLLKIFSEKSTLQTIKIILTQ
ncbi:MAG: T9SS type A sorting domain-containing protein, partial [Bacteroidia bacterium]|nr:T9SS type A sorting domain-containing protein [Bacteroidia bacterium]